MDEWKLVGRWICSLWQQTISNEAANVVLSSLHLFFWLPFISMANDTEFFFFIFGVDLKFPFETNLFNWEKYIYFKNNTQLIELRVIDGHGKNWDGGAGATEAA